MQVLRTVPIGGAVFWRGPQNTVLPLGGSQDLVARVRMAMMHYLYNHTYLKPQLRHIISLKPKALNPSDISVARP